MTCAGSLGIVFTTLARLYSGSILDKLPLKLFFILLSLTSATLSFTFHSVATSEILFMVYISVTYFIFGCYQAGMPVYYAQTFGPELGSQLYPYFFTASCFANFVIALLVYEL